MHDSTLRRLVPFSQDATLSLAERDNLQEEVVCAELLNYISEESAPRSALSDIEHGECLLQSTASPSFFRHS
jgi:hypothetical protein